MCDGIEAKDWWSGRFTRLFNEFEFEPGGRWAFAMRGPSRHRLPARERLPQGTSRRQDVIEPMKPWYEVTTTLTAHGDGTHLSWVQDENLQVAAKMRALSSRVNEEVCDPLEMVLRGQPEPGE